VGVLLGKMAPVHGKQPLAIDLYCGLGGWTEGLIAEGYRVVGFDNERHTYGDARYPAQLVIQDVLTLHGRQFKDAALIVASPPCQAYSYRAMPWKRAKALPPPDNTLFEACFRIQREACEAAGRFIPLVVENVCGAQKWVGRARWHFGSFYLWGDVPALMPIVRKSAKVNGTGSWFYSADNPDAFCWRKTDHVPPGVQRNAADDSIIDGDGVQQMVCCGEIGRATKNGGGSWFNIGSPGQKVTNRNPVHEGAKQPGIGGTRKNGKGDGWFQDGAARHGSKSSARKAASAHIAKIPFALSCHIARAWYPTTSAAVGA
jgi:hypothetical protein